MFLKPYLNIRYVPLSAINLLIRTIYCTEWKNTLKNKLKEKTLVVSLSVLVFSLAAPELVEADYEAEDYEKHYKHYKRNLKS